jgi:hypothetical protein
VVGLLAGALVLGLSGCGAGGTPTTASSTRTNVPAYVTEPFTPEQKLVAQGARLVVGDGCSACHLHAAQPGIAPDFLSFAGHRVKLSDGRSVLVDERFVREGLLHPTANEIKGYDPAPMLRAVARLRLGEHPTQVAELAAFIEQIGPETE